MPLVDCHQQEGFLMFHQACVLLMFSSFFDTPVSPKLYKNQKLIPTYQFKMYILAMYIIITFLITCCMYTYLLIQLKYIYVIKKVVTIERDPTIISFILKLDNIFILILFYWIR